MILNPTQTYPTFKAPVFAGVPEELRGYQQWICWKLEQLPSDKKPRKVPYSPLTHQRSGSTEKYRQTWGSFDDACNAYETGRYSGISFAVTASDPFVVIDFDHCVHDGTIEEWVGQWIEKLDSYTEISPSGTGIHIIMRGMKPGTRCKRNRDNYDIEMYEKERFLTITGHIVDEKRLLGQDKNALTELYNERLDNAPIPPAQPAPPPQLLELDDHALLEKIRSSKQAAKFDALMSGSTAGYGSQDNEGTSEADAALCMILAWWTNKDTERIDRLFRTSQLIRPKWDELRGAKTYGQITIENAIKATQGEYKSNNVVPIKSKGKKTRKIQTIDTGYKTDIVLFPDPVPWPDTGNRHYIDRNTGGLYLGEEWSDSRDLIAMRPIWIHSIAKDEFNERYRIIKFYDEDFIPQNACFPAQWFSKGKDTNIWCSLMSRGMILNSGKEKYIARYLDAMTSVCKSRSWAASKLGWFDPPVNDGDETPVFILPDKVIGNVADNSEVFFQTQEEVNSSTISSKNTLTEWKKNIATKAKGNHLIMFAISCGLAGGITKLASIPSGGFHFWGIARTGKTALLQCAASVWGNASDPQTHSHKTSIRKWNATSNGLEATAQLHNDIVLCLDEIKELEPNELSKLIYTLTGGTPKGRMRETGGLRNQAYWHIMLISSGEESTEQILKSIGQTKRGGQTHRLPDIRIDGLKNGIIQTETDDCSELIDNLKRDCAKYYGTAGPVFISWILSEIKKKGINPFINEININIKSVETMLLDGIKQVPNAVPNEIRAVLKRISAIAVAALYASEAGVVNWTADQINTCMIFIRNLWLTEMEDDISELEKALAVLRSNIIANIENFLDITDFEAKIPYKITGYKDFDHIMILPKSFDEFCGTYNRRQLLKKLLETKFLFRDEEISNSKRLTKKIPSSAFKKGKERPRCYFISREFLDC